MELGEAGFEDEPDDEEEDGDGEEDGGYGGDQTAEEGGATAVAVVARSGRGRGVVGLGEYGGWWDGVRVGGGDGEGGWWWVAGGDLARLSWVSGDCLVLGF